MLRVSLTFVTVDELYGACGRLGVSVSFVPFPLAGAYFHHQRLIVIDSRLSEVAQRCALAHEYVHAIRGDEGEQPASVERIVDETAARILIDPDAYAAAEHLHGGYNKAAIAEELGVEPFVVSAYRRCMERAA